MGESGGGWRRVAKWALWIVVAVVAVKILFALLGIVLGLAGFLLFVVAPLVILGWVGFKAFRWLAEA